MSLPRVNDCYIFRYFLCIHCYFLGTRTSSIVPECKPHLLSSYSYSRLNQLRLRLLRGEGKGRILSLHFSPVLREHKFSFIISLLNPGLQKIRSSVWLNEYHTRSIFPDPRIDFCHVRNSVSDTAIERTVTRIMFVFETNAFFQGT